MFLKVSRLIPRRSLAQEFCDNGLIVVNDAAAKSSKEIKAGDLIEIHRRDRISRILVLEVPAKKQVAKNSAGELYRLIEEKVLQNNPLV